MMDKIKHHEGKKRRRRDFSDKKKILLSFATVWKERYQWRLRIYNSLHNFIDLIKEEGCENRKAIFFL